MAKDDITITPVMDENEILHDNVQVRCYPKKGKIERMKCVMFDEDTGSSLKDFKGTFRIASVLGDGSIVTKGDDVMIIGGTRVEADSFGKCASVDYPDGEHQLLCKFWRFDGKGDG